MAEINDLTIVDASNIARFPENQNPSTVNNGARALEGILARFQKDAVEGNINSTNSGNDYSVAANRTLSAYYDGMRVGFHANAANTGAVTLNVDSIGAKSVTKYHDVALASGDIEADQYVEVVYSASDDAFQLLTPVANAPSTAAHPGTSTDNALARYDGTAGNLQDFPEWTANDDGTVSVSTGEFNLQDNALRRALLVDYAEESTSHGTISATFTLDMSVAHYHSAIIGGATTLVFGSPPASGKLGALHVKLTNAGTNVTISNGRTKDSGGNNPTLTTSGIDWVELVTDDAGTNVDVFVAGEDMG